MINLLSDPSGVAGFFLIIYALIEIIKFLISKIIPKKHGLTQEEHDWLRDLNRCNNSDRVNDILANIVLTQKEILIILKQIKEDIH